jgi:histidinol-phosphate aminotransferase
MDFKKIVRPSILDVAGYKSARSIKSDARIFLDANEMPEASIKKLPNDLINNLNRYPAPQPKILLSHLSRMYKIGTDSILIGRGSDEAIDIITRTFCEPGEDSILINTPTYGMYKVSAGIQGLKILSAPLIQSGKTWKLNAKEIKKNLRNTKNIKLVYICSPNNPTGTQFSIHDISAVCKLASGQSVVVLDEAYAEFSGAESGINLLKKHKNLIVLRTLSKAWGLAGLRCGALICNPELKTIMLNILAPYPLPQPVIKIAEYATKARFELQLNKKIKSLVLEKKYLILKLKKNFNVVKIYDSQANFILVEFKNKDLAFKQALEHGICLRDRHEDVPHCLRITIGSHEENKLLIAALRINKDQLKRSDRELSFY